MSRSISPADLKLLWYRSGGRCAICRKELSIGKTGGIIGEMAHIVAHSNDGPRGDSGHTIPEVDSYANLILLCPNHHTQVDKQPEDWPAERLERLKRTHEDWVRQALAPSGLQGKKDASTKCLFVISGPSGAGKDVIIHRLMRKLEDDGRSVANLRRFTTRPANRAEIVGTPFAHLSPDDFRHGVASGRIACIHTSLGYTYGCDSSFCYETPPRTLIFYSIRVYTALEIIKRQAEESGLQVRNILLKADEESIRSRVLMRSGDESRKLRRIDESLNDLDWLARHPEFSRQFFDVTIDNSDSAQLRDVVRILYDFVSGTMQEIAELQQWWEGDQGRAAN